MHTAVIGMGTMGAPMARNLLAASHDIVVYNRTASRTDELAKQGARTAASPADAARNADIVLICVSDTADVRQVLLDDPGGVITTVSEGALVIDCSTISPSATRDFADVFRKKGVGFVDAPVSGGSEGAIKGTLAIMCGGSEEDMARARPLLEVIGASVTHVGPVGAGQVTKAVNQIAIAGTYRALAEGLVLASRAGVDPERVVAAISGGAAASWVLDNRADNMIRNTYPLGFRLRLHRKDLKIALEEANRLGVSLDLTHLVARAEDRLLEAGFGDEDMSTIARGVRDESGLPQESLKKE